MGEGQSDAMGKDCTLQPRGWRGHDESQEGKNTRNGTSGQRVDRSYSHEDHTLRTIALLVRTIVLRTIHERPYNVVLRTIA